MRDIIYLIASVLVAFALVCEVYIISENINKRHEFDHVLYSDLLTKQKRLHGLNGRFHVIYKENGKWMFKDDTGRVGRFL